MNKVIILILLFTLTSAKLTGSQSLKIGEKYIINDNAKEFTLNFEGLKNEILLLYFALQGPLTINYECGSSKKGDIIYASSGDKLEFFEPGKSKISCNFHFTPTEGKENTLIIIPTKNPLKLKLKNKYELPSFKTMSSLDITEFKFTVQDLEKDKTAIFQYHLNKDTDSLGNPFTVCEGSNCQKNISIYEFKKGKTYTILVGVKKEEIDYIDYILTPGFSFYAQDYDGKYHEDDISYDSNSNSNSNSNYIRLNLFLGCLMLLIL